MRKKLLILTLVAFTQNQSLEEELAGLEEELINAGFDWLVNATIDENLDTSTIEVFTQNGNETLAVFENIQEEKFYKIYLTNLNGTQDVFDLRINGSIEFDQILDPAPTMSTVKINSTTNASNENLKGYCNATDADGDDLAYQYQWYNGSTVYLNGTLFKEGTISTGNLHTCGIRANDSRVLCGGYGDFGQLGDENSKSHNVLNPNLTTDSSAYSSVSAGYIHTCGIRANDSRVLCWGYGGSGRLGDGDSTSHNVSNPNLTTDSSAYLSVSSGISSHTCGIRANDSRVLCWGDSGSGKLGDGQASTDRTSPYPTTDNSSYSSVSAGYSHTCGIRTNDSRILCWGQGDYGQLGDGSTSAHYSSDPNVTTDSSAYANINAGDYHTCGIRANDSRVLCWGTGDDGQVGDGTSTERTNPTLTSDTSAYSSISAGGDNALGRSHTCGIRASDGRVLCWGDGGYYQTGDGGTTDNTVPTLTSDSSPYKKGFSSGEEILISILGNSFLNKNNIWKWSCRAYDFTEYSSWMNSSTVTISDGRSPIMVINSPQNITYTTSTIIFNITATDESGVGVCKYSLDGATNKSMTNITASQWNATNSSMTNQTHTVKFYCNDSLGNMGDTQTIFRINNNPIVQTATINSTTNKSNESIKGYCNATDTDGDDLIYQYQWYNGSTVYYNGTLFKEDSISASFEYTCGIRASDSRVLCWGESLYGRLGDGQNGVDVLNPNLTTDNSSYISVSAGYYFSCGIRANDSRILCWGEGEYGRLGDGNNSIHNVVSPNITTDSSVYSSVSAGDYHTCGIRASDGRVLCWGQSDYYQLGDGQNTLDRNESTLTTDTSAYKKGFGSGNETLVSILGNAFIKKGEIWKMGCRAYDFNGYSSWMNSSTITILSGPPTMATVKINSTTSTTSDNINGYCNATDKDGDDLAYQYQWYNGSTVYFNGTIFKDGSISTGYYFSCGIRANDSRVLCWGQGLYGQLGDGQNTINRTSPYLTTDISSYKMISAGYYHTCGIRANDSRVLCWGESLYGRLGDGQNGVDVLNPNVTTDNSSYFSVSAGGYHSCGIRANDSRVLCWGYGLYGQVGNSGTTDNLIPNVTTDASSYKSASAGYYHSCGIRANDSRVLCWGRGDWGNLGDREITNNLVPNITTDSSIYSSVSPGGYHTCGIRANDSRVLCWGYGNYGQLGDGNNASHSVLRPNITTDSSPYKKGFSSSEEVLVSILGNAYLNVGQNWSLGCRSYDFSSYSDWMNSSVMTINTAPVMQTVKINSTTNTSTESIKGYCNATDFEGSDLGYQYQWYNGSTLSINGTIFKEGSISAGWYSACGIRANDSRVVCWGYGAFGVLGDGSTTDNLIPNVTADASAYKSVSVGDSHACGIRQNDSRVLCWGRCSNDACGDGQTTIDRYTPYPMTDSSEYLMISASNYYTCGIRANDSRVLCWGWGDRGEMGDGISAAHTNPIATLTTDTSGYKFITTGDDSSTHSCGIRLNDSRVLCWGEGSDGQLGDGDNSSHNNPNPNITTDSSAYTSIALGYLHTCGIRANDSRVLCWGNGYAGQLGDGIIASHEVGNPTLINDASPYLIITSGYENTCGIRQSDKRVLCWGSGTLGGIGNGNNVDVGTPTLTLDSSAYSRITGGFEYYCGIRTNDSRVLCWGYGDYGALGDSSTAVHNTLFPNLTVDNSSYVKGFSSGNETLVSTLASSFIKKGENWKISCRAYDFTSYSSWMNSTTMTILNGPPVMATVKINSTTNTKNNSIYGYCNATDEESDDLAYQYQWYNGSTVYFNGTLIKEGSISTGHYFSCGIRANDSRVLCWGQGLYGQLGDGQNTINRTSPYLTTDISSYSSISAGEVHTCGIRANDSRVLCWGESQYGRLGDTQNGVDVLNPNLTTDSSPYTIANAGYLHTCGIRTNDSRVLCWGYGANGQVGDGENPNNLIPNIT